MSPSARALDFPFLARPAWAPRPSQGLLPILTPPTASSAPPPECQLGLGVQHIPRPGRPISRPEPPVPRPLLATWQALLPSPPTLVTGGCSLVKTPGPGFQVRSRSDPRGPPASSPQAHHAPGAPPPRSSAPTRTRQPGGVLEGHSAPSYCGWSVLFIGRQGRSPPPPTVRPLGGLFSPLGLSFSICRVGLDAVRPVGAPDLMVLTARTLRQSLVSHIWVWAQTLLNSLFALPATRCVTPGSPSSLRAAVFLLALPRVCTGGPPHLLSPSRRTPQLSTCLGLSDRVSLSLSKVHRSSPFSIPLSPLFLWASRNSLYEQLLPGTELVLREWPVSGGAGPPPQDSGMASSRGARWRAAGAGRTAHRA